jgi:cell division septal protein FtsQ
MLIRHIRGFFLVLCYISPLIFLSVLIHYAYPRIDYITVHGPFERVTFHEAQSVLKDPLPAYGNSLSDIALRFKSLAWIRDVVVVRGSSNHVAVFLKERKAALRYGDHDLISDRGALFHPSHQDHSLDYLPYLLHRSDLPFTRMYAMYSQLKKIVDPTHWVLLRLVYNDDQGWVVLLNQHVQLVLGREQPQAHLKRFIIYADQLPLQSARHIVVDARYKKGFALRTL